MLKKIFYLVVILVISMGCNDVKKLNLSFHELSWLENAQGFVLIPNNIEPVMGFKKYEEFLLKRFNYPEAILTQKIHGVLFIDFYIDSLGRPYEFNYIGYPYDENNMPLFPDSVNDYQFKDPNYRKCNKFGFGVDEEAKRIILQAGKWKISEPMDCKIRNFVSIPFSIHPIRSKYQLKGFYSDPQNIDLLSKKDSILKNREPAKIKSF